MTVQHSYILSLAHTSNIHTRRKSHIYIVLKNAAIYIWLKFVTVTRIAAKLTKHVHVFIGIYLCVLYRFVVY